MEKFNNFRILRKSILFIRFNIKVYIMFSFYYFINLSSFSLEKEDRFGMMKIASSYIEMLQERFILIQSSELFQTCLSNILCD